MADYDDIRREVVAAMSAHDPGNLVREALERINRDAMALRIDEALRNGSDLLLVLDNLPFRQHPPANDNGAPPPQAA